MPIARYFCTHCGRRFEAEEKEHLECPGCFWSTSVKKDTGIVSKSFVPKPAESSGVERPPLIRDWRRVGIFSGIACGVIFLGVIFLMAWPQVQGFLGRGKEAFLSRLLRKPGETVQVPLPSLTPEKLTAAQKQILSRRVEISSDRPLSAEEKRILEFHAPFQTGFVEKLPSQMWSVAQFKELIANQERNYKVPLPGSYKGKLEKVFKEKYLKANEAFEKGDLLKARDLWVESLVYPIYDNNVSKHRGVILTMLRSFINDTLSKIGAVNTMLGERVIREKEQKMSEGYEVLFELIEKQNWAEAHATLTDLEVQGTNLQDPNLLNQTAPPYPPPTAQVDQDIQAVLMNLLVPAAPATADMGPLRQDLTAKKMIIETRLPESVKAIQANYDQALAFIQEGKWQEAKTALQELQTPPEVAQDAQEKIEILERLPQSEA